MSTSKNPPPSIAEAIILEELFLDQLQFKLAAAMNLYTLKQERQREIDSFIDQLQNLTDENISLLQKYVDRS